jgi:hypothetical protein
VKYWHVKSLLFALKYWQKLNNLVVLLLVHFINPIKRVLGRLV